MVVVWVR
jgi:hypothetical protein